MLSDLTLKMKTAAGSAHLPTSPTASVVWGITLAEVLKVLVDQAVVLGRAYRDELDQAAKSAVDAVIAFDLPLLPDTIENTLDDATRAAGYAAIDAVLDAILGPAE